MSKLFTWVKANLYYIVAYVVFITVFWFIATPKMSKFEAYFGLVCLHLVFAGCVYLFKKILAK